MAAETFRITEELVVEDRTGQGFESASKRVSAFDKVIDKMQERLKRVTGSRWDLTVDAVDKATQVINSVENRIAKTVGKAWNFTVGAVDKASTVLSAVENKLHGAAGKAWDIVVGIKDTFTAPFRGILNLLKNPLVQAGAFLGVSFGIKDIAETGMSFESAMSQVAATMGTTVDQIGNLQATAQEMGATTAFTATQAAEGLNVLAMAGLKAEEQIAAIPDVLNLASAGAISLESAASYAVGTVKGFSDSMENAQYYVDLIAKGSTLANTSLAGLGEAFSTSASEANRYHQSADSLMISLLRLAEQNITGAEASTMLSRAMADIYDPSDAAQKALKRLGIEAYTGEGKARDFNDIVNELNASLSQMSDEQANATVSTIFDSYGAKAFGKMIITTTDKLAEFEEGLDSAFGSAAAQAATQLDNLAGDMTLLQSAADGVKLTISSRLSPYLRTFVQWLTGKMPDLETAAGRAIDFVEGKIADLRATIEEFTSSDEWANADIWGKITIAWDKIIAEPFSAWWNSTGKPWLTEKVAGFGATLGSGITAGLLALLGFDASGAVADGVSIGASFIEGFKSGFDMDRIGEAITEWASDHKGIVAAAGIVAGGKLIGGFAKAFQTGKSILGDITGLFGSGSSGGTSGGLGAALKGFSASTMTVTAGTVIVNGSSTSNAVRSAVQSATGGGGLALPGASSAAPLALPGTTGGQLALPGATGGTAAAGGLTSAGSWLSKLLTMGSSSSVVGADGTLLAVQGGVGGTLGNVAGALGSGATTAAGAAAVGAGSIAGAVGGVLGLGSAIVDLVQGIGKSQQGDAKGAKDEYVTAGTKTGMVGAGAAAGAAIGAAFGGIGAVPGALIGAGIGGVGALLGGDKAGKALSDATDEGGLLNNAGKAVGGFFTETLPHFVTQSIPAAASRAGEAIGGFASSVGSTIGGFFTETIPTFLTEQVPYAAGFVFGAAETFFTETVPARVGELLTTVGTFFSETVPTWAEGVAQSATTFFTETVPGAVGSLLQTVGGFFTETLPAWAEGVGQRAAVFFGETVPTFVGDLFTNVGTFFTETVPEWATGAFDAAATFFTEDIPQFMTDLWGNVTGFVTETIPQWGRSIGDKISGWWGSISGWFSDLWDGISGSFSAGREAGNAAAGGKHAEGGIMNAPHMAQVAEDGPEAIIPLGASSRSRGMAVWEQAGDILGVGSNDDGLPGANIPLGSGNRSRSLTVWEEIGGYDRPNVGSNDNGLGNIFPEGGPHDMGSGNDVPVYSVGTPGPAEAAQGAAVNAPVSIVLNQENNIQAADKMSAEEVAQILNDRIRGMVDNISDEMAEQLARIFANMPVKGGA